MLELVDWLVIGGYVAFALIVGVIFARRAGQDVDEFFLSGRSLPWWITGTSMVATTFAADTPLVVTGWVRDHGIWKNWLWWCFAAGGLLTVFVFARYWRRGGVMTTAELAELRYGGSGARVLRGFLGFYHSGVTNALVLCWVLLAASKILDVLFGVNKLLGLIIASIIALTYSLMAGFWGVVLTDLVQFVMAMVGSIALAVIAWNAVGGGAGVLAASAAGGDFTTDTLRFLPHAGEGGFFDASFWTVNVAAIAVYLGVSWWANDSVDGGGPVIQRIAATKSERDGVLATLWYSIAHFALRPWPWFAVALASLIVLPNIEVRSPAAAKVTLIEQGRVVLTPLSDSTFSGTIDVPLDGSEDDWVPRATVAVGDSVEAGAVLARTDSERAYVVMMTRYLPAGLLGLAAAALLAAFMSTIDTHVNLAAAFFVNDVYRRFLAPAADARHYVRAARFASVGVLALGGLLAYQAESIGDLYLFFLAFLGGVGPIYVLRWLWWRVRASTEIAAMIASSVSALVLSFVDISWPDSPLTPGGELAPEGRLCLVVFFSSGCALLSMLATERPDPYKLTDFYRRVKPMGAWGPVRALCPDVVPPRDGRAMLVGVVGGLMTIYGLLFGLGHFLLERPGAAGISAGFVITGAFCMGWAVPQLTSRGRTSTT